MTGTYTILLVYDPSKYGKPISFADISMALYNPEYTPVWAGSTDQTAITNLVDKLESNQFVVTSVDANGNTQ